MTKNVGIAEIVCTSFKTHPVIVLDRGTFFWESECAENMKSKNLYLIASINQFIIFSSVYEIATAISYLGKGISYVFINGKSVLVTLLLAIYVPSYSHKIITITFHCVKRFYCLLLLLSFFLFSDCRNNSLHELKCTGHCWSSFH